MRSIRQFWRSRSGTSAIEFAIICPVMLTMFAGVVEIGRLFQVYNATNRIATQLAIVYADCSDRPVGSCSTEIDSYMRSQTVANVVPQLTIASLSLTMFQVSMTGSNPTIVYAAPIGASLTSTQIAAAQGLLASGDSGVVVTATYTHTLQFFQSLMNPTLANYLSPSFTVVQLKG